MTRGLQKIGNSKGLVLTRTMLDHLGATDEVEVLFETDRIIITAPRGATPRHQQSFEEAKQETFLQYDEAMHRLADAF